MHGPGPARPGPLRKDDCLTGSIMKPHTSGRNTLSSRNASPAAGTGAGAGVCQDAPRQSHSARLHGSSDTAPLPPLFPRKLSHGAVAVAARSPSKQRSHSC